MPMIGVCGDSFFAATQDLDRIDCRGSAGKHFTEILSKTLGYDLFTLARGACSNTAIRLQIDEMIRQNCDFVLIGVTSEGRIEYPLESDRFYYPEGIYNIIYNSHPDLSSLNSNFVNPSIVSETINNVLTGYGHVRDEEQRRAIEFYHRELFVPELRQLQDAWILSDGIRTLIDKKIPYIIFMQDWMSNFRSIPIFANENPRHLYSEKHKHMIPFYYDTSDEDEDNGHTKRRYHVSDKKQVEIANHLCNYIQSNNLLVWS